MGVGGVKNFSVGIGDGAPSTARSSLNFFSPQQILKFTEGWFYCRENYTFSKIQIGSNIFQGVQLIPGGGGGGGWVQMLISIIETQKSGDFPGVSGPPYPPSGPVHGYEVAFLLVLK